MNDRLARQLCAEEADARTNPLYAVKVRYRRADTARARGVPVAPELAGDAKVGILDHESAYDPKYGRDEDALEG